MTLIIAIGIISIDLYLLFRNKGNRFLLLLNFFILYFDASVLYDIYIFKNVFFHDNIYIMLATARENVLSIGLYLIVITSLSRFLVFCNYTQKDNLDEIIYYKNDITFFILFFLAAIIIIRYDRGEIEKYEIRVSAVYEYLKVIFCAMILLSHKSWKRLATYFLMFLAVVQDILFGGRVFFIQNIILILLFLFPKKIQLKYILFIFPLIYISNIIQSYRAEYVFQSDYLLSAFRIVNDTFSYAFFGGLTVLYSALFTPFGIRIKSFCLFVLETFIGSSAVKTLFSNTELQDLCNLSEYGNLFNWNLGGVYYSIFFYFWGGWLAAVVFSLLFWYAVRYVISKNDQICILFSVFLVSIFPRWFFYNFNNLFRTAFLFFIIYFIIKFFQERKTDTDHIN